MSDDNARPPTKHDPDCIPSTWITESIPVDPAGDPKCLNISGRFEIKRPATFPTVSGGELRVGPGAVNAAFWISIVEPRDEFDALVVETWLADDQGGGWRCRSYVDAFMLVETERLEPFQRWDSAPQEWKQAMSQHCLLRDLSTLLDGRETYELRLSSGDADATQTYVIKEKHQGPILDLALVKENGTVIARVSRINHEVMPRDWRTSKARAVDMGVLPTYAYELSLSALFPLPESRHSVGRYDFFFDDENPKPVTFYPWQPRGTPQANVVATGDR